MAESSGLVAEQETAYGMWHLPEKLLGRWAVWSGGYETSRIEGLRGGTWQCVNGRAGSVTTEATMEAAIRRLTVFDHFNDTRILVQDENSMTNLI
jgi:hypothetical protein